MPLTAHSARSCISMRFYSPSRSYDNRPDTVGQPLVGDESTSQTCFSAFGMTEIIFVV